MTIQIFAAQRLEALAEGDKAAEKFLKGLGFNGLTVKTSNSTKLEYHYTEMDEDKLNKKLGKPRQVSGENLNYNSDWGTLRVNGYDETVAIITRR